MNEVLADLPSDNIAQPYLDDICVSSDNWAQHLKHLKQVMNCIRCRNLKLKLNKCKFGYFETNYLGFHKGRNGIGPDPDRVESICKMSTPRN